MQILVTVIVAVPMTGIALYFYKQAKTVKLLTEQASSFLSEEVGLVDTLETARDFMLIWSTPELRAELLKDLASEVLEVFNYWRMGVKSGENKKLAAVEGKLTDVIVEEIAPALIDDPIISKVVQVVGKNARVREILQDYDVSLFDLMELAGPILQNMKLGAPQSDLDQKKAQSDDGVIWFV